MHENSMLEMAKFAATLPDKPLRIGDVGSQDFNGCYRRLFARWDYVGLDIARGPNVDIVLVSDWSNAGTFDVVVSGQVLEHVAQPWRWMEKIARIMRPDGLLCVIAPNTFPFHEYPIDAWRVWPAGMCGLFDHAGLETINAYASGDDTVGIARLA